MFPESGTKNSIDPALFALMNNNGGFGGANWIWILFLWLIWGGYGMNGFGNGMNNGTGFLSNQINNEAGRDLLLQAINGRADGLQQLAGIVNTNVNNVQNAINTISSSIQTVSSQVGMSGLQVTNAIQSGDASLSRQLCECCCENRLLTTQQGYEAQLRTVEQTNQLGSQADRNTRSLADAIAQLQTNMTREFCDIREREMQSKIDTQSDIITQLRGQLDNDRQTAQLFNALNPLQAKVNEIADKQPNTVPVQWPNLTAVNTTPYVYGYGWNNGWGSNSFWN